MKLSDRFKKGEFVITSEVAPMKGCVRNDADTWFSRRSPESSAASPRGERHGQPECAHEAGLTGCFRLSCIGMV